MERGQSRRVSGVSAYSLVVSAKTSWIVVELRLDDGSVGYGEATDFARHEAVLVALRELSGRLIGHDVPSVFSVLALNSGYGAATRVASSGVEQALLDAVARWAGTSIATLLGGARRTHVPVYANINRGVNDRSPSSMAAAAGLAAKQGYQAVKIAPFDEVQPDQHTAAAIDAGIARIFAVRDAIGSDIALRVDCHLRLSRQAAEAVLHAVDGANLDWIEDVLDPGSYSAEVRRALRGRFNDRSIRVAGGEDLWTVAEALELLAAEGLDILLPDLRQTGVRHGLVILELASARGVEASLHSPVSPILDGISLQVGAAASSFYALERQVNETPLYDELADVAVVDSQGNLWAPIRHGSMPRTDKLQKSFEVAR